jgi:anti-sigma factor RsiW
MSEPEALPSHVHQEVALLPWFVNGTLGDAERQQVANHLAGCKACRMELEDLKGVKTELTAIYAAQPGPSPTIARSVLRTAAEEASIHRATRTTLGSWVQGVDQWLRSLLLPRWVPTLAATILLAQLGLLLWTIVPTIQTEEVTTRSVGMQTARFKVTFQNTATEEQIRSLLQTVRGRLVDGPTVDGNYTIEVLAGDESTAQNKLEMLRLRTEVVRSAVSLKP